jgi:hypothetical protein
MEADIQIKTLYKNLMKISRGFYNNHSHSTDYIDFSYEIQSLLDKELLTDYRTKYLYLKIMFFLLSNYKIFFDNNEYIKTSIDLIKNLIRTVFHEEDMDFYICFILNILDIIEDGNKNHIEWKDYVISSFKEEIDENYNTKNNERLIKLLKEDNNLSNSSVFDFGDDNLARNNTVQSLSDTFISYKFFKETIEKKENKLELFNFYNQLKKEGERIEKIIESNENSINLNTLYEQDLKHLYVFKSSIDYLDNDVRYDNIKQLFCKQIFRSKIFLKFMSENLRESKNFTFFTDQELNNYKLYKIGTFLVKEIVLINNDFMEKYFNRTKKVIRRFIEKIENTLIEAKTKEKFRYLEYKIEECKWNGDICSLYFSNQKKIELNENFVNLSLFNISKNEKLELIYLIRDNLVDYEEVVSFDIMEEESSVYLKFVSENVVYYLVLLINSVNFQRLNIILEYLSMHPLASILFCAVKQWAERRNILITVENYKLNSKNRSMNIIQLGMLVLFFLIQNKFLPVFKFQNENRMIIEYYINQFVREHMKLKETLYFCEFINSSGNRYKKVDSKSVFNIGYLFTSFFYFMLTILDASREDCIFVDLREDNILKKNKCDKSIRSIENRHLVIVDFFFFYKNKEKILNNFVELEVISKFAMQDNKKFIFNFKDRNLQDEEERKIICDLNKKQIDRMKKEVCRLLSYTSFEMEDFNLIYIKRED